MPWSCPISTPPAVPSLMSHSNPNNPWPCDTSRVLPKQLLPLELPGLLDDPRVTLAAVGTAGSCSQPSQPSQEQAPALLCSRCFILSAQSRPCCNAAHSHQREPWIQQCSAGRSIPGHSGLLQAGASRCWAAERAPDPSEGEQGTAGRCGRDLSWEHSFQCRCFGKTQLPGTAIATREG